MPEPAAAVMFALLVTETVPVTPRLGVEVVPPMYPAAIPAGVTPFIEVEPEFMVALFVTVIVLPADARIAVASLTVSIPVAPDVMESPAAVETDRLPVKKLVTL